MTSTDESSLIKRLIEGDEAAYRSVVTEYHGLMQHVARRLIGDSLADEVVQEAWVSVLKSLPKFQSRSSLKTWILKIVTNAALSRLKKESRTISMGDAQDVETSAMASDRFKADGHWQSPPGGWAGETPESLLAGEQLNDRINHVISRLPEVQQTILCLRDMEGMEMEDICKILDISESNSRVLLHRARTKVWEAIDRYESE